jgi:hypothetical protein
LPPLPQTSSRERREMEVEEVGVREVKMVEEDEVGGPS